MYPRYLVGKNSVFMISLAKREKKCRNTATIRISILIKQQFSSAQLVLDVAACRQSDHPSSTTEHPERGPMLSMPPTWAGTKLHAREMHGMNPLQARAAGYRQVFLCTRKPMGRSCGATEVSAQAQSTFVGVDNF